MTELKNEKLRNLYKALDDLYPGRVGYSWGDGGESLDLEIEIHSCNPNSKKEYHRFYLFFDNEQPWTEGDELEQKHLTFDLEKNPDFTFWALETD
jgi:hypothetical protein